MRLTRSLVFGLACGLWLTMEAASPGAQAPSPPGQASGTLTPTFRTSVRWVDVDAVVRDARGNFVTGLTRDDFELLEDNVPQTLERATLVDLPPVSSTVAAPPPVAEPAARAEDAFQNAGRLYVLMLSSGTPEAVRRIARLFVDQHMGALDRMAVINVHGRYDQGLTSDKAQLLKAIEAYRNGGSATMAALRTRFATLKEAAISLGNVTGRRKSILLIDTGFNLWETRDVTRPDDPRPGNEDMDDLWRMLNETTRAANSVNVPIHTISPLAPVVQRSFNATSSGGFGSGGFSDSLWMSDAMRASALRDAGRSSGGQRDDANAGLGMLSEDTRGIRIINTTNFSKGFDRIVEANSQYYMLGYYSNVESDGRQHRITIRVKRPGLTVKGRSSFRALNPEVKAKSVDLPKGLTPAARVALKSGTGAALPLDTTTVMYRGEHFQASVLVNTTIKGTDLSLGPSDKLEYAAAAFDKWGRVVAVDRRAFSLGLRQGTRSRIEQQGVHLFSRLTLPYGEYEIRVMAQQPDGKLWLKTLPVSVPDFTDRSLLISDVVVGAAATDSPITLLADDTLRSEIQGTPATVSRFSSGQNVSFFAEIFDTQWLIAPALGVTWTLRAAGSDAEVRRGDLRVDSSDKGRTYFKGVLPTGALAPGTYVLELEAFSVGGPPSAANRQFTFEIVGG